MSDGGEKWRPWSRGLFSFFSPRFSPVKRRWCSFGRGLKQSRETKKKMGLRQQSWNSSSVFLVFLFSHWDETKWKHWRSKDHCNFFIVTKQRQDVFVAFMLHFFFLSGETPFINLCWNLMQVLTDRRTNRATDVKTHLKISCYLIWVILTLNSRLLFLKQQKSPTLGFCADGARWIVWQICR